MKSIAYVVVGFGRNSLGLPRARAEIPQPCSGLGLHLETGGLNLVAREKSVKIRAIPPC